MCLIGYLEIMTKQQGFLHKTQISAISLGMAVLLIPHTFCFLYFDFYPTELYLLFAPSMAIISLLHLLEKSHPNLMRVGTNILYGIGGPLVVAIAPDFAILGYASHYIGLLFGVFFESNQSSLSLLLGSNLIGWSVAAWRYIPDLLTGAQLPQQIHFFFGSSSNLGQVIFGLVITYITIAIFNKEKNRQALLREQYKSELLILNGNFKNSNRALEEINKTLQEMLAEKESFILRFSHEIRNPLNSLLGNVELCHESPTLSQEDRKMLQDAKISGEILLQLLNNILDSAKISTKRLEVNIQMHEVRRLCEDLWVTCSDMIGKAKLFGSLAINFNVPSQIEFDELRMRQIVMNLLTNAIKFTHKGFINTFIDFVDTNEAMPSIQDMKPRYFGITQQGSDKIHLTTSTDDYSFQEFPSQNHEILTLNKKKFQQRACLARVEDQKIIFKVESHETRPSKAFGRNRVGSSCNSPPLFNQSCSSRSSSSTEREGYMRIEIVDSGCGIKEEDLKNVFKHFEKNYTTTAVSSDRHIGAGLGLWITKELVELMGGKIEIYSKPNVGTCLVIMIKTKSGNHSPRPDENRSRAKTEDPINSSPPKKRVLIVEDIAYNQEVNRKLIQKCGINHISIASNGLEALELFRSKGENYFDAIFTDLDMPIMDGKTSTKLIREHERKLNWKPVRIIVLTGFSEAFTQKEMLNPSGPYRANAFLSKPSSFESIMKALKNPYTSKL